MANTNRRQAIRAVALGATLAAGFAIAGGAAAQAYPDKPITYIIPFNAGGESDVSARFQQSVFKQVAGPTPYCSR